MKVKDSHLQVFVVGAGQALQCHHEACTLQHTQSSVLQENCNESEIIKAALKTTLTLKKTTDVFMTHEGAGFPEKNILEGDAVFPHYAFC